jgi:hypothetical protein
MINYKCKIIIVTKEFISKASLLKNLPLPLFTKESRKLSGFGKGRLGGILLINVFILMTILVIPN